jgi:3-keto-disaccharide hydrolase
MNTEAIIIEERSNGGAQVARHRYPATGFRHRHTRVVRRVAASAAVGALFVCSAAVSAGSPLGEGPAAAQNETGFQALFNGRDLTGWVSVNCAPDTWSVRDGMIHSTGKPICELRSDRMYENFILELEYKHLVAGGNAGVFIWGDALTARGQPFVRAIEVQVLDGRNSANATSHGDVFAIHGARMTPDRPHPAGWMRSLPSERRARPAGEWNHYRITARNGTLKLAVNGAEVSGGYDIAPRKGYIHLESEGGTVLYRNLRLKELPSAGSLLPDQIAQPDEGFVSLYSGVDFKGWQFPKGHQEHWVSRDWVIAYDGRSEADDKGLWTEKAFGDAVVIADWRRTAPRADAVEAAIVADTLPLGIAGVELPADARAAIARTLSSAPPGQWRRAILTKRSGRMTLTINGESVLQDVPVPGLTTRARIGLRHDGRPVEFASIFIKELGG